MCLLFFMAVSLLPACKKVKEQKENKLIVLDKDEYYPNYPDFYNFRLREYYENIHNGYFANPKRIISSIMQDSLAFIPFLYNNAYIDRQQDTYLTFKSIILRRDRDFQIVFYKFCTYYTDLGKFFHIEYPVIQDARIKAQLFVIINPKNPDILKSAFIIWSSKPANTIDMKYSNKDMATPIYMWGINKTTDTITTNLSLQTIKSMYLDFEHVYNFKKYKSIEVDYQYTTMDDSFFKHIKFNE